VICLQGWAQTKTAQNQNTGKNVIVITHVPKYNTFGFVEGKIIGDESLLKHVPSVSQLSLLQLRH